MMELKIQVEHLAVAASDPEALKDWYVELLGATVKAELNKVPPAFMLQLPGGTLIEIYRAESAIADTSRNSLAGWRHVALRVDSIEAARDALAAKRVVFDELIKPAGGGGRVLFFRDPEGNLFHLVERPPDSPMQIS
jgi:glyoxylase I family protein